MREILFRGKLYYNGEWVYWDIYGRLTDINGEPTKVEINTSAGCLRPYIFFSELPIIDDETVGEYTGLTDKNGKRIFEGDIVKLYDTLGTWRAAVEFGNPNNGNYGWGWQLSPLGKVDINTDILCWVEMEEAGAFCEVIGNIHDNPEFLEVKDETRKADDKKREWFCDSKEHHFTGVD